MATREAYAAAAAALILLGCDKRERAKAVEVAPPRPIDARSLAELPASTHAAIASAPRDEWPCAFDVAEHQANFNETGHCVFSYGKRTACRMPAELLGQGVWGCPDQFVRTDSDGMVRSRTFTYDDQNRLVDYSGQMHYTFKWDGDWLASTTSENVDGPHTITYVDDGDRVLGLEKGELVSEMRFQQGRLVKLDEYLYGHLAASARLVWQGARPLSIDVDVQSPMAGSVQRSFSYECR